MIDIKSLTEKIDKRVSGLTNTDNTGSGSINLREDALQSIKGILGGKKSTSKTKSIVTPYKPETPFDATTMGIALNTVLGLPKATLKVGKDILQGTARGIATIGRDNAKMVDPKKTPAGKLFGAKRFFGTEDPFSLESETKPFSQLISDKFGFDEAKTQKVLVPFIGALNAMDIITGGGKRKLIEESIKTVTDLKGARRIFTDAGVSDDVIDALKLDSRAVETKTAEEAVKLVDEAVKKMKTNVVRDVQASNAPARTIKSEADAVEIPEGGIVSRSANTQLEQANNFKKEVGKTKNYIVENTPEQKTGTKMTQYTENVAKKNPETDKFEITPRTRNILRGQAFDGVPIEILNKIKVGGGAVLKPEELKQLGESLSANGYDSLSGTVYKSFGGNDVILGTTKINGQVEYIVAGISKDGKKLETVRLHGTPISNKDIIGQATTVEPMPNQIAQNEIPQIGAPKIDSIIKEANSADNSPILSSPVKPEKFTPENLIAWKDTRGKIERIKDSFIEKVQDEMVRVRKIVNDPRYKITDESNPYDAEIRFHGRVGTRLEELRDRTQQIDSELIKLGKTSKVDDAILLKQLDEYLVARHAPERNAALGDGAAGITTEEALKKVDEIEKLPYSKELRRIADEVQGMNNEVLNILKEGQVITNDLYTLLRTKYKNHIPLQRVFEQEDDFAGALAKGFDVKTSGIKTAKGSKREVNDVLGNVIFNYEQALIRAEKNRVDLSTLKMVRDNQEQFGDLFKVRKPKAIGKTFDGKPIMEMTQDPQILVLREKGKPIFIEIKDPSIASALRGVGRQKLPGAMRYIAAITRFYSGIHTRFNPEFAFTNKIRDIQELLVYAGAQRELGAKGTAKIAGKNLLKGGLNDTKPIIDFLRGVDSEGSRLYKEMRENGGTTGGMGLSTRKQVEVNLDDLRKLNRSNPRKAAMKVLEYVDKWNQIFEDSSRLSIYREAIANGATPKRAAVLAKESTVNFNKFGTYGSVFNSLYMFSNASIQGSTKTLRAMKNPKVVAAVVTTVGASVYAANEWNSRIDPDWRSKVTTWDRLNGMPIMLPSEDGKVNYITLPVAWGIKPIKVMFDQIADVSDGKTSPTEASLAVLVAGLGAYNPAGGTDLISATMPTILDLPVDIARNKAWHGGKIRPDWDKNAPASIQYFPSLRDNTTGRTFTGVSKGLSGIGIEVSPANLNYAFEQLIGGAGRTTEKVFNTVSAISQGEKPEVNDVPFVSRFYKVRSDEEIGQGTNEWEKVNKILESQSKERFYLKQQAEDSLQQMENVPPEKAVTMFNELVKTDRVLAEKVLEIKKQKDKGLTNLDRAVIALGVENGERSKYIIDNINALETPKEKAALWNDYVKKGIITKEVAKQLKKLLKES